MLPLITHLLGIKISMISRENLKEYLIKTLYDKDRFRVMIIDERKFFQALFDHSFRKIINTSDIVLTSSSTVSWALRVLNSKRVKPIMPVTVFLDFMRASEEMNYSYYLFGHDRSTIVETARRTKRSFPHARLVGAYHIRIKGKERENVLIAMRKSAPQIYFAGLKGGKKQEKWLSEHKEYFPGSIVVGVDNAFRIIAGKEKMPPINVQKKGRVGLYRTLTRPYDIARLFRLAVIFFVVTYHRLFKKDKI